MKILWINHASYLLEAGSVRLVCDPWLEGPAFNNGWQLLSPSRFAYERFAEVTHIWLSHEHPDHFSPTVLKKIDVAHRKNITVLYRKTRDRRVVSFCAAAGFSVLEVDPGKAYELDGSLRVVCGTVASDSWLLVESAEARVLNTNDCALPSDRDASAVRRMCGRRRVDVLLTQFSYANWCGNPDDAESHRAAASQKLDEMRRQIRIFEPGWVVPFASFIWFAHEENVHMNRHVNRVEGAARAISETGCQPVVLYPGDEWTVGIEHDPSAAIRRYADDSLTVAGRLPIRTRPVKFAAVESVAAEFRGRLRAKNWIWTLKPLAWVGYLVPVRIYLTDHDRTVAVDMERGLTDVGMGRLDPILEMSAESLWFALKFEFGIDTLLVNGRFREVVPGATLMLSRQFAVARHNNDGFSFPGRLFDPRFVASRLHWSSVAALCSLGVGGLT
jgi:UDP-MurNAc hydroxylase